jgi:hypothetical protein
MAMLNDWNEGLDLFGLKISLLSLIKKEVDVITI